MLKDRFDQPSLSVWAGSAPMKAICSSDVEDDRHHTEPITAIGMLRFGFELSPASSMPWRKPR